VTIYAAARTARSTRAVGWVPFALVALVLVPALAGSLRLVELAGGPQLIPANPRLTAAPVPVLVHIISALTYALLGAFQFSASPRRRRPGWHRTAGRVLVLLGLVVAFSALCLTLFYPRQPARSRTCSGSRSGRVWPPASSSASPRSAAAMSPATGRG
jgi:hypothetical protein